MKFIKGWLGEMKTNFYLWFSLPPKTYHRYHNLILPSKNGTTQIDHLIISVYGVFIVETKNKKGWIFGSENQDNWTQTIYGKNYSFQNPLKQSFRQKAVLSEFLNLTLSKIQTVVYFVGDCRFKTEMPENVINNDVGLFIKRFQSILLSTEEVEQIVFAIKKHVTDSSLSTSDHIESLQQRHNSTTICPKCGSNLVEKTATKDFNPGVKFLGCKNFPKCKFTKNI
ncbi:MAG: NERD domain-containing protein [Saprospiraceae bacterium]|nr:NERD domain-containing protein [Saprospiraceae bacterium]